MIDFSSILRGNCASVQSLRNIIEENTVLRIRKSDRKEIVSLVILFDYRWRGVSLSYYFFCAIKFLFFTLIQIQVQYSEVPYGSGNPAPKCQGSPTLMYLRNTFSSVCYGQFVYFVLSLFGDCSFRYEYFSIHVFSLRYYLRNSCYILIFWTNFSVFTFFSVNVSSTYLCRVNL